LSVEIADSDKLWKVIQKVWIEIDMKYINKLIKSVSQYVNDIYKAIRVIQYSRL
ncbi:4375_t:CDS:1, partial [Scutellospora calospora]